MSEEGSTLLNYLAVCQTPEALEVLKLVFDGHHSNLDIDAVDWDGYTPLMR